MAKNSIIKWVGSKRKQAPIIINDFPKEIDTFYEPFFGSGAVTLELLERIQRGEIKCNKIVCSDISKELIDIWNIFKNDHNELAHYYTCKYDSLVHYNGNTIENPKDVTPDVIKQVQEFFYKERDRFNSMNKDNPERPELLFWLLRTCYSGLARYNKKGEFNSPFHVGGKFGIHPDKLYEIFEYIKDLIDGIDIQFVCDDYRNVIKNVTDKDLLYFDPPYANVKGIYEYGFNSTEFFDVLQDLTNRNIKWLLSYDGTLGVKEETRINKTVDIDKSLYKRHFYIDSFNSSFRTMRGNTDNKVTDSIYINY